MIFADKHPSALRSVTREVVRVVRCRLHASSERLLGGSEFEVGFPLASPAVVVGPNGSGKSLCASALQLVLGASQEEDGLRADLLAAGVEQIEVEFTVCGQLGRLLMFLQTREKNIRWGSGDDIQNGSLGAIERAMQLLSKRWVEGTQAPDTLALNRACFVRGSDLALPVTRELLSGLRALALSPIEREMQDWTARMHALAGEREDGGRLAQERDTLANTLEHVRGIEELQLKLEQAQQFNAELQVRMVQLMSQLSIITAEHEEWSKLSAMADRTRRVAAWLDEIHREHEDVAWLRDQHAQVQERLDVLEQTFRGAPENLESLLQSFRETAERIVGIERKHAAAEAEIRRLDEAIAGAQRELDECVPPSAEELQAELKRFDDQIGAAEVRRDSLLRGRIELIRQREGLQHQLRQDYPLYYELDPAARQTLREYFVWRSRAGERAAARARAEQEAVAKREQEINRLRGELRNSFSGYEQLPGNASELVRELFDRRRVLGTLKTDSEELQRRKETLDKRSDGRQKGVWIVAAAALGAVVGAVSGGWDFALFAALVASGLALLVLRMLYGGPERELDAVVQGAELIAGRTAETEEAILRLEAAVGMLASFAAHEEAVAELERYYRLREQFDDLISTNTALLAAMPDPEQDALEQFRLQLPAKLIELPMASAQAQYGAFEELEQALVKNNAAWREYDEGGVKARELAESEARASSLRQQSRDAMQAAEQHTQDCEARRRELSERLTVLEAVRAVERPAEVRAAELLEARERLAQIVEESAGFIGQMEPEAAAEQLAARDALRTEIRKIRDALSAKQSLDELRARETLLAEELESMKEKLTEMDPLYLLDGTISDYAAKYARQLAAAGDSMSQSESAIDTLRRDLETVEVEHWSKQLSQCEPLEDVKSAARQLEEQVRRTEHEVQVAKEALGHLREEYSVVERTYDEEFLNAVSQRLLALSDGRCRRVQYAADRISIELADGSVRSATSLSGGLSDVVWVAVRLALLEHVQDPLLLPVFWDEPFTRLDDQHLSRVQDALARLGQSRQVVVLTRDSRLSSWGELVQLMQTEHRLEEVVQY